MVIDDNSLSYDKFATALYKYFPKDGNIVFSPLGAYGIFSMILQTIEDDTSTAIQKLLHTETPEQTEDIYNDLSTLSKNVKEIKLSIATKIFLKDSYKIKPAFLKVISEIYKTEIESIDFSNDASASEVINKWVKEQTENRITSSGIDVSPNYNAVVVNTLYLKNNFIHEFQNLEPVDFTLNDDQTVKVPMVSHIGTYGYKFCEDTLAHVVEIPFKNEQLSMILIVPREKAGYEEMERELSRMTLDDIMDDVGTNFIDVRIPKFKVEGTVDLNDVLGKHGVDISDPNKCNISGFLENSDKLNVDKIIQKVVIEVDGEGVPYVPTPREGDSCGECWCQVINECVEVDQPFMVYVILKRKFPQILLQARVMNPLK